MPKGPIAYPPELNEVANQLRAYLDEQWQLYRRAFAQGDTSLTGHLGNLLRFAPGDKRAEVDHQLTTFDAQVAASFQAFYAVADALAGGDSQQGAMDIRTSRSVRIE